MLYIAEPSPDSATTGRTHVVARALELDGAGQVDAGGDGLVDDDGVGRQDRFELGHEARDRDRRMIPALGRSRALGLAVLGLEATERLVAPGGGLAEGGAGAVLHGRAEGRQRRRRVAH